MVENKKLNRFSLTKAVKILFFNHNCPSDIMADIGCTNEAKEWSDALEKGFKGVV